MPDRYRTVFFALCCFAALNSCSSGTSDSESVVSKPPNNAPIEDPLILREKYNHYWLATEAERLPATRVTEVGKVYPVDEAPLDTAFFVFREALRQTLRDRDAFGLMSVVAKDIRYDYGSTDGTAGFVRRWGLDNPVEIAGSPIWDLLSEILAQGGIFTEGGSNFVAPYTFACFPGNGDPATQGIVTGTGVRAREKANVSSAAVYKLSHDVVDIIAFTPDSTTLSGETYPWAHIRHAGQEGYIFGKYIKSPLDYRAFFSKTPTGGWELSLLLSGD